MGMTHPIQTYREARKLNQADLAKLLGCSPSLISLIESGEREVTRDNAEAWESVTGIPRLSLLYPDEFPYQLAAA